MAARVPLGRIMDVIAGGRDSAAKVDGALTIDVRVDSLAPRWMALALKEDLDPAQSGATVDVRRVGAHRMDGGVTDAAVVLGGGSERLVAEVVRGYLAQGVPVALVVESSLDAPELGPSEEGVPLTLVAASERAALDDALADWLLSATDAHVTMAANFPFCREREVERLTQRCALANAAVGAVDVIHGADLPIMCANQLKLLFDLAAAHGRGLSADRVPEAALVVALSFAYRAMSRSVRRLVPLPKFAVRASLAYAGTVATAKAVEAMLAASEGTLDAPSAGDALAWLSGLVGRLAGASPDGADGAGEGEAPAAGGSRTGAGGGAATPRLPKDAADEPAGGGYITYPDPGAVA